MGTMSEKPPQKPATKPASPAPAKPLEAGNIQIRNRAHGQQLNSSPEFSNEALANESTKPIVALNTADDVKPPKKK